MKNYRNNPRSPIWHAIFEDGDAEAAAKAAADKAVADKAAAEAAETMTKADSEKLLVAERQKNQGNLKKALDELELLKAKATMTDEERTGLEGRIEVLSKTIQTKEEIAKTEFEKFQKKMKEESEKTIAERDDWKNRFTQSTIETAITAAAVKHKAYYPPQIMAIMRATTTLTDKLDDDGKPTGQQVPMTALDTTDKDGKPVVLNLSVDEAIEKMKEMPEYQNLFNADGSGGAGAFNRSKGKPVNLKELARNPEAYRKAKADGKVIFK